MLIVLNSHNHNNPVQHSLQTMKQTRPTIIEMDDVRHEGLYRKLMKSCIPSSTNTKCQEYMVPYNDTTTIQRIAILTPPGDLSGSLIHRIESIIKEYND